MCICYFMLCKYFCVKIAHTILEMRFREEIIRKLGGEGETSRIGYTVIDGKGGYFQNVKRLLEFSSGKIVLKGRKGAVFVEGENLSLGKFSGGDVAVLGNIMRVSREGG